MKDMTISTPQQQTTQKEIRIGNTVFSVTTVYKGKQELEPVLLGWAIKKVLASANC